MLEFQNIDIPLSKGYSEGDDPFLLDSPKLGAAINVSYRKRGALTKRNSYDLLATVTGAQPVIFDYQGDLAVLTDTQLQVYDEANSTFRNIALEGLAKPAPVDVERVTGADAGLFHCAYAESNGVGIYMWSEPVQEDYIWRTRYTVVSSDGAQIVGPTDLGMSGAPSTNAALLETMAVTCSNYLVFVGVSDQDLSLQVAIFDTTSPTTAPNQSSPATNIFQFDLTSNPAGLNFWVISQTATVANYGDTVLRRGAISGGSPTYSSLIVGQMAGTGQYGTNGVFDGGLCVSYSAGGGVLWCGGSSSRHNNVYAFRVNTDLTSPSASIITVHTYATDDFRGNGGFISATPVSSGTWGADTTFRFWRGFFVDDGVAGNVTMFWTGIWSPGGSPAALGEGHYATRWRNISLAGTPSGNVGIAYYSTPCLRGWYDASLNGQFLVMNMVGQSYRVGTVCVRSSDELIATSRFMNDTLRLTTGGLDTFRSVLTRHAGSLVPRGNSFAPCNAPSFVGNDVIFAIESKDRIISGGAATYNGGLDTFDARDAYAHTMRKVLIRRGSDVRPSATPVRDSVVLANGNLLLYDGFFLSELAAGWIPSAPSVALTTSVGGVVSGTLEYFIAWVFIDKDGREYRTTVSPRDTLVFTNQAVAVNEVTISCPRPPPSQLFSSGRLRLEVYQTSVPNTTTVEDGVYILAHVVDARDLGVAINPFIQIRTSMSTAGVVDQKLMPGQSGEIQAEPTGASTVVTSAAGRVWYVASDEPHRAYFSVDLSQGQPIEFNGNNFVEVPNGENLTAIASMDETVVFFTNRNVFLLRGRLPNNVGGGASFDIVRVESGGGCLSAKSVAETHLGVFFLSNRGICLLDRNYSVSFVGEPVEDSTKAFEIVSADHLQAKNQVLFTTTQTVLAFDYESGAWSYWLGEDFSDEDLADATIWDDRHVVVDVAGGVWAQSATAHQNVVVAVGSPWIKLTGIQGFKRIKEILLLGDHSIDGTLPGDLQVSIYTDYDATVPKETIIFPYENLSTDPTQIRIKPAYQKCQSIRFVVSEIKEVGGQGDTWDNALTISAATLVVGKKKMGFKTPRTST